jgi:hypothetical protein
MASRLVPVTDEQFLLNEDAFPPITKKAKEFCFTAVCSGIL